MRLMHTRLPDMFAKMKAAAKLNRPDTEVRVPETAHTVIMKGIRADGSAKKAILENLILTSPPALCELYDVEEVEDRRTPFKVAEPK